MRIFIILLLIIPQILFSQGRGQWSGTNNSSNFQISMSVKGKLVDSETRGSIFCYHLNKTIDSILVLGGISDENGKFKIDIDFRKMISKVREERTNNSNGQRLGMDLFAEIDYLVIILEKLRYHLQEKIEKSI